MPIDDHTSQRTSLGLVLQLLVEEALRRAHIKFIPNAHYHNNFIKPDALIPNIPPTHSIHVTCTGADNSFQMKKWRYIDEVLQMRSTYTNNFLSINIMFGAVSRYQKGDIKLINKLFDYEILVEHLTAGNYLYNTAIQSLKNASQQDNSKSIAEKILVDEKVSNTVNELSLVLKNVINSNDKCKITDIANLNKLEDFLIERKQKLKKYPIPFVERAFWKRTLLRFLAVPPEHWDEVIKLAYNPSGVNKLPLRLQQAGIKAKLILEKTKLDKRIFCDPEVIVTLKAGLDAKFLNQLKIRVETDPRRKFELEDLWDDGSRARIAVNEVIEAFRQGRQEIEELLYYSITQGGSPKVKHHRCHVLDVIISALEWSQNKLQELYEGPSIGVADPIRNLTPRTEIAQQALEKKEFLVQEIVKSIVDTFFEPFSQIELNDINSLVKKYLDYRIYCLVKGSSIDPLKEYIEEICLTNGWLIQPNPRINCNHPIIGKITTEFSIAAKKGSRKILVKCLFGDTGADHKAEEMEARIRIIKTCSNQWSDATTIFVADGKWKPDHFNSLFLGGWDFIVAVNSFNQILRNLD